MCLPGRINPLPIQIRPKQITPVIPINHPIDIQHRYDLENEVLPQHPRRRMITQQIIDDVFDQMAHHSLAWVDARCEEYDFLLFRGVGGLADCYEIAVVAGFGEAQGLAGEFVALYGVELEGAEVALQVGVGVGVAVGDVDAVVVV